MTQRFFNFQVTRFVILFVERAGSTYLTTLLNSHPQIRCVTEKLDALKSKANADQVQLRWTSEYLSPKFRGLNKAIGFKTKEVDILDQAGFARLIQHKKCRIIQLQRRNTVKAVISTINAKRLWEQSGNWNLLKEQDRQPPMTVDYAEFDELIKTREKWDHDLESFVQKLHLPTLPLFYEDLLQDEDKFIHQIFDFLQVEPQPVRGKTLKHTSDDLREVITNFDELRSHYAATPYEAMFDRPNTDSQ